MMNNFTLFLKSTTRPRKVKRQGERKNGGRTREGSPTDYRCGR